jgi:hypothetical protein
MSARYVVQVLSGALVCLFLGLYIAAKIHFFTRYGQVEYLREHRIYWAGMAATGFLIWLSAKLFPQKPR